MVLSTSSIISLKYIVYYYAYIHCQTMNALNQVG